MEFPTIQDIPDGLDPGLAGVLEDIKECIELMLGRRGDYTPEENYHPVNKKYVDGKIIEITSDQDNLDVSGCSAVIANTSGGNIVIGGLSGGVLGQKLIIFKILTANNLTIEHAEGVGNQDFQTDSGDIVLGNKGGVHLICRNNAWYVISDHSRT